MNKKLAMSLLPLAMTILTSSAQVHFRPDTSWLQTLEAAKAAHKGIFVDCFATWCGPCKQMDLKVYPNKAVGKVYNKQFVSIRLQMDTTKQDIKQVRQLSDWTYYFKRNYHVNAYPTLLFFDEDGKPVHKAVGGFDVPGFIRLANEAENPDKQYYRILRDFKPNKIDTAEEKGLAEAFKDADDTLAGKIAADYLMRIPKSQIRLRENEQLLFDFKNTSGVKAFGIKYFQSLSPEEFKKDGNLAFLTALSSQPEFKRIAIAYIEKLPMTDYRRKANHALMSRLSADSTVQLLANQYIDQLPEDTLYRKDNIQYLTIFTKNTHQRGFGLFYNHTSKVDSVMQDKDYAEACAEQLISDEIFKPLYKQSKLSGTIPDLDLVRGQVTQRYTAEYADRVVLNSRLAWYKYLVYTKNDNQYWPQLIDCRIQKIEKFHYDTDTIRKSITYVNEICYGEIFEHSNDKARLTKAAQWMKNVVERAPEQTEFRDTYANILYKLGDQTSGLANEEKALELAKTQHDDYNIKVVSETIEKMKKGQQTWE